MNADDIRSQVRAKHGRAFLGFEKIAQIADDLIAANEAQMALDTGRVATLAAIALYTKSRKCARAIHVLATEGYGEDAFILGRSLINLAIDLEYICGRKSTAEALARQWFARGRLIKRDLFAKANRSWPAGERIEWSREAILAKAWKDCSIEQRARAANMTSYYELPYRHGCSFDHSDSWSAASFLHLGGDDDMTVGLRSGPSERFVEFALLAGAFAMAQVTKTIGDFYSFDFAGADTKLENILRTEFPIATKEDETE
jgi:hypothetical protein